ncbi:hypothetical protein JTE90_010276 [Oedothorax gibbosus]|uniref:Uncharacterized protein n=1 Tax=Oedothorax gibbosus TaxID=931172 RepID=A0AAV6U3P6_9ARAC|nr:hypothetical protein JTE90_010276 [Oedothorax gibbosus]
MYKNAKKEDILKCAAELEVEIPENPTILNLRKLIEETEIYKKDPGFVGDMIASFVEELTTCQTSICPSNTSQQEYSLQNTVPKTVAYDIPEKRQEVLTPLIAPPSSYSPHASRISRSTSPIGKETLEDFRPPKVELDRLNGVDVEEENLLFKSGLFSIEGIASNDELDLNHIRDDKVPGITASDKFSFGNKGNHDTCPEGPPNTHLEN